MANYKTVFTGINGSNRQGDEIVVTQNSIETDLAFDCYNADRTAYTFKSGDVVTASFIERGATGGGYRITGTITPLIGGSSLTWRRALADVGTPGIYMLSFKVVGSDARADWSTPVKYTVQAVAGGDITPPAPLVGVSVSDAAWLELAASGVVEADIVQFNEAYVRTGLEPVGAQYWDSAREEMAFTVDDFGSITIGKEIWDKMTNLSGVPVTNGDIVSTASATGNRQAFTLTDATDTAKSIACIGMVTVPTINNNESGRITKSGIVRGLNTDAFTEGAIVYVDPLNPGKLTQTQPQAPDFTIAVGTVTVKHPTEGIINVNIRIVSKFVDSSDVNGSPLDTTGLIPVWDNTGQYFDFTSNISDFDPAGSAAAAELASDPVGSGARYTDQGKIDAIAPIAWYEARTLQLAENAPASTLMDLTSNGNNLTSTGTARPLYKTNAHGMPYLYFDGIDDFMSVATAPVMTQPYTLYFVFNYVQSFATAGNTGVLDGQAVNNSMAVTRPGLLQIRFNTGTVLAVLYTQDTSPNIYKITANGASSEITGNSRTITGNAGTGNATGLYIGGFSGGSLKSEMDFYSLMVFNGTITDQQDADIRRYLMSTVRPPVIFIGDSITNGTAATVLAGYVYIALEGLGLTGVNLGVGGKKVSEMLDDAGYQSRVNKYAGSQYSTAVIFGGTNDYGAGADATETYNLYVQLCNVWKAQGFKIVAMTMLPRTGAEVWRATYNGLIRANYTTFADALADVASDVNIGQDGDNTDLTYYNADAIHPNSAGHLVMAGYVETAVDSIIV